MKERVELTSLKTKGKGNRDEVARYKPYTRYLYCTVLETNCSLVVSHIWWLTILLEYVTEILVPVESALHLRRESFTRC
jgi:hypothetical protein